MTLHDQAQLALEVPLLRFLGARFDGWRDERSVVLIDVGPNALNANAKLHGGAISAVLDVTGYLALLPTLQHPETAVTHSMNTTFFGAASEGDSLRFEARIIHRGRSLAVIDAEVLAWEKRIAIASICKSILVLR